MGYECVFNGDYRVNTQPDRPRAWTKKEVDGLMFRLLQVNYELIAVLFGVALFWWLCFPALVYGGADLIGWWRGV